MLYKFYSTEYSHLNVERVPIYRLKQNSFFAVHASKKIRNLSLLFCLCSIFSGIHIVNYPTLFSVYISLSQYLCEDESEQIQYFPHIVYKIVLHKHTQHIEIDRPLGGWPPVNIVN